MGNIELVRMAGMVVDFLTVQGYTDEQIQFIAESMVRHVDARDRQRFSAAWAEYIARNDN